MKIALPYCQLVMVLFLSSCGTQQDTGQPKKATVGDELVASPKINQNRDRIAYFGDVHIHTRNSMDAYIFNARTTPDEAYRYAKGQSLRHPSGYEMTISGGPLDFFAVTDHAEYLGVIPSMDQPDSTLKSHPLMDAMKQDDYLVRLGTFMKLFAGNDVDEELNDVKIMMSVWKETVESANRHNDPGVFTTFAAFEYSATTPKNKAGMLHRNVIFRNEAPARAFSSNDSDNPEDLWDWLDMQRSKGFDVLAIPHNPNLSEGWAFKLETFNGEALSKEYAIQRMRNEPLVEVTQIKGTSETHPLLSPNDEWADFEIFETISGGPPAQSNVEVEGRYIRDTYQQGLMLKNEQDFNPFKFGMIGASDSHLGGAAYAETNYVGKFGFGEQTAALRGSVPPNSEPNWTEESLSKPNVAPNFGASGLTGVWAESNTRDAIFDAMRRKETFATTGPRIKVRFFAGFDFEENLVNDTELISKAYANGVSMGGDLIGDGRSPSFIVWAQRDANSVPLQRVQIVKLTDVSEQVFDVACATGTPDPETHRCIDNGASVNMSNCAPIGDGAAELKTQWYDPSFNPNTRSNYYVRVLENPSCRWSTFDAIENQTPPRPGIAPTIQERAYSSPIWYSPVD